MGPGVKILKVPEHDSSGGSGEEEAKRGVYKRV